jgi:hypothetical protein
MSGNSGCFYGTRKKASGRKKNQTALRIAVLIFRSRLVKEILPFLEDIYHKCSSC